MSASLRGRFALSTSLSFHSVRQGYTPNIGVEWKVFDTPLVNILVQMLSLPHFFSNAPLIYKVQSEILFFSNYLRPGRALNPHPHTRFFRGFFAVQKFFDYTISFRKSENPILYSKGTSDRFWTHM